MLLLLTALVALRLVVAGTYDTYVRAGMRIPLLLASGFLALLGLATAFRGALAADRRAVARRDGVDLDDPSDDHGHDLGAPSDDHDHRPSIGWLLAAPLTVLVLIAPPALGADAAGRQDAYAPQLGQSRFPELPAPVDGAVDLRLAAFVDRALWDAGESLDGTPVRLEGFVDQDASVPDGFLLTRFQIACCAADAVPIRVAVLEPPAVPDEDQWVRVTGVLVPPPPFDPAASTYPVVELTARSVEEIPEPASPYE
jgi:uncharacterized repeat protein (TIGR03943 family)